MQELSRTAIVDRNIGSISTLIEDRPTCRICLETETASLICPCICKGNSKFVHEKCLREWITIKFEDINQSHCEICKTPFKIKVLKSYKCHKNNENLEEYNKYLKILVMAFVMLVIAVSGLVVSTTVFNIKDAKTDRFISVAICALAVGISLAFFIRCLFKLVVVVNRKFVFLNSSKPTKEGQILPINY
ncbi:hypothetical protein SteCoe_33597 [Stentor coeruleus]|uniref:RING-CH-type domain-containing protein n=1 Tax=Stentor coeruleus TaxID=5963 RepID=A0A1R2AWC4_9CILI|nr:hypothetical protein SteCoe_33597 [Stentor coeruleus]